MYFDSTRLGLLRPLVFYKFEQHSVRFLAVVARMTPIFSLGAQQPKQETRQEGPPVQFPHSMLIS